MTTHSDEGMSLVEVIIAMFLFMIVAVAVLPLTLQVVMASAQNRDTLEATAFAKDRVSAIQADYPATPGDTSGSCAALQALATTPPAKDATSQLSATLTVGTCPTTFPASVPVTVTVTEDGDVVTTVTTRVRVGAA